LTNVEVDSKTNQTEDKTS